MPRLKDKHVVTYKQVLDSVSASARKNWKDFPRDIEQAFRLPLLKIGVKVNTIDKLWESYQKPRSRVQAMKDWRSLVGK